MPAYETRQSMPYHRTLTQTPHKLKWRRVPRRYASRRGLVILCVLACLVVVTTMSLCNLQFALRGRTEARQHQWLRQATLLCNAGIERAQRRLQSKSAGASSPDAQSPGAQSPDTPSADTSSLQFEEQWQPLLSESNPMECVVTIQVERDELKQRLRVRSSARLVDPASPFHAYQRSEEIFLPLSQLTSSGKQ